MCAVSLLPLEECDREFPKIGMIVTHIEAENECSVVVQAIAGRREELIAFALSYESSAPAVNHMTDHLR